MGATVFLDTPMDDREQIDCEEATIAGEVVWARPKRGDDEIVVPLSNVTGLAGGDVTQEIEETEYKGGRVTELVTRLS